MHSKNIIKVYQDAGISVKRDKRPAYKEMIRGVKDITYDT